MQLAVRHASIVYFFGMAFTDAFDSRRFAQNYSYSLISYNKQRNVLISAAYIKKTEHLHGAVDAIREASRVRHNVQQLQPNGWILNALKLYFKLVDIGAIYGQRSKLCRLPFLFDQCFLCLYVLEYHKKGKQFVFFLLKLCCHLFGAHNVRNTFCCVCVAFFVTEVVAASSARANGKVSYEKRKTS